MATETRAPTSDVSLTGTWTETATTRWTFVDDYPSQDSANQLTHGTATPGEGLFGFSAFTVPAGSLNIVVKVSLYAYKNSGAGNSFATRIRAGSTPANADGSAITTLGNGIANIALFTQSFTLNPKTAAAWTVADVNGAATNGLNAFGIVATDANPSISITSIQLQVDYDPAILTVAVGDQITLSETITPKLISMPSLADTTTLSDTASAQRYELRWLGDLDLFLQPTLADTVTITDGRTVIIPVDDAQQFAVADQVTVQDTVTITGLLLCLAVEDIVTVTDAAVSHALLQGIASESLDLTDMATAEMGTWEWWGQMHLMVQPHPADVLTTTDVVTVGNDRAAEIAWIQLEVPASSTEVDVPFGRIQSGLVQVQIKYRGSSNKVRAIIATNLTSQDSILVVNDNGTEHLITIPAGTTAQELELDEEVTLGAGVSVNMKTTKGEPQ